MNAPMTIRQGGLRFHWHPEFGTIAVMTPDGANHDTIRGLPPYASLDVIHDAVDHYCEERAKP